jgi:hypothetical protein
MRLLSIYVALMISGRGLIVGAQARPAPFPPSIPEERILLPVVVEEPIRGAYGSLWETEIAVVNATANVVFVYGVETGCLLPTCGGENVIGPDTTLYPRLLGLDRAVNAHFLKFTDSPESVVVQLTVQDKSRAHETWGTSVPSVRERDAWATRFQLLDVPGANSRFRSLLRLYSFDPWQTVSARVRFYRINPAHELPYEPNEPDVLLAERMIELHASRSEFTPGYADLGLWSVAEIADGSRLRIEVLPETAGAKLWGMVSVTNNDTQHVTIIAPN